MLPSNLYSNLVYAAALSLEVSYYYTGFQTLQRFEVGENLTKAIDM